MKKNLLIIPALLALFPALGQHQNNFGLAQPQAADRMPQLLNSTQKPVRVEKVPAESVPHRVSQNVWLLDSGWELTTDRELTASAASIFDKSLDTGAWYNATVPGTILTTLVDQGVYPDPYWGMNNLTIPDSLCRMEWWYRNSFRLPPGDGRRVKLLMEGINYRAEVWLNARLLGIINGAFSRGEFDITGAIDPDGENILAVKIFPPSNPGIPQESSLWDRGPNGGVMCLDGPTFISSEGWDWVPGIRDRNIGIWQDVKLIFLNEVEIADPFVITDLPLPDTTYADLTFRTTLKNTSDRKRSVTLTVSTDGLTVSRPFELMPHEVREVSIGGAGDEAMRIDSPRLWWPNGYGRQELYDMQVSVTEGETVHDTKQVRFGVRELEYELTAYNDDRDRIRINFNPTAAHRDGKAVFDNLKRKEADGVSIIPYLSADLSHPGIEEIGDEDMGVHLVVKVNGTRIYCKGGNWGMDDAMKRVSRERLEPYFELHKQQNFTMIRNWTGESTEEVFYALCDEYGMLVLNDFWLSTETYNLNVSDNRLFMANAEEVVKRFRNHPSIALWCPRNEGFAPAELESRLVDLIASADGTRHWLPSSIRINMADSGPWVYNGDPATYYTTLAGGFKTELGTHSPPTAETIREMMDPADTWPISDVWYYHDFHTIDYMEPYMGGIATRFGEPADLDDFSRKSQLVNYEAYRAVFESWNSRMWSDASGVLLWMSHPAWPSFTWQTYAHNCETAGSYYGAKKGCSPVHIQLNLATRDIDIINTTRDDLRGLTAEISVYLPDGRRTGHRKLSAIAPSNCRTPLTVLGETGPGPVFVKLTLKGRKGLLSDNTYILSSGYGYTFLNDIPTVAPEISVKNKKQDGQWTTAQVTVRNSGATAACGIRLNLADGVTGRSIRPALFSDGYFFLMPGETKTVDLKVTTDLLPDSCSITAEGYNISPTLRPF